MTISEMKSTAKTKLTGSYLKCILSSLLYFLVIFTITSVQNIIVKNIENSIILAFIQAIVLILSWLLGYGIISNIIELAEVKTNSITDFLNTAIKNTTKYLKIALQIILNIWIPIVLFIIALFYLMGTLVANVHHIQFLCFYPNLLPLALVVFIVISAVLLYFILDYMLIAYIYHDNTDLSPKEVASKSKELMKNNKLKLILLYLSFLNWYLVAAIILMILNQFIGNKYLTPFVFIFYSLVKPYITISKAEFYESLGEVETE